MAPVPMPVFTPPPDGPSSDVDVVSAIMEGAAGQKSKGSFTQNLYQFPSCKLTNPETQVNYCELKLAYLKIRKERPQTFRVRPKF